MGRVESLPQKPRALGLHCHISLGILLFRIPWKHPTKFCLRHSRHLWSKVPKSCTFLPQTVSYSLRTAESCSPQQQRHSWAPACWTWSRGEFWVFVRKLQDTEFFKPWNCPCSVFRAPPRSSSELTSDCSLQVAMVTWICASKERHVFATQGLSLWLYTLVTWFF